MTHPALILLLHGESQVFDLTVYLISLYGRSGPLKLYLLSNSISLSVSLFEHVLSYSNSAAAARFYRWTTVCIQKRLRLLVKFSLRRLLLVRLSLNYWLYHFLKCSDSLRSFLGLTLFIAQELWLLGPLVVLDWGFLETFRAFISINFIYGALTFRNSVSTFFLTFHS